MVSVKATRRMGGWVVGLGVVLGLGVSGCTSVSGSTSLGVDGSFARTVVVKSSVPEIMTEPGKGPKLEDWFVFPTEKGWSVTRAKVKNEDIATLQREFPAGTMPFTDTRVKEKGKTVFRNRVSVVKRADGLLEYTETLAWDGPKDDVPPHDQIGTKLKAFLPDGVASEEQTRELAKRLLATVWREMFGPGDPLLGQFLAHPAAAERRLRQRAARGLNLAVVDVLGPRMSDEQRANFLRRVFAEDGMSSEDVFSPKSRLESEATAPSAESNSQGLVAMLTSVRVPGTVVSTNGEVDLGKGEVYWAYYPQSALLGEVTLSVVVRPSTP